MSSPQKTLLFAMTMLMALNFFELQITLAFSSSSIIRHRAHITHLFENQRNTASTRPDFFQGAPSTPGWESVWFFAILDLMCTTWFVIISYKIFLSLLRFKPGQFEKLSSWATSTASNRPVVAEYNPDGLWLWTQWSGKESFFHFLI